MPSRGPVRTNAIIFSVLGLVVGLLIHFIVLSSSRYNWIDPEAAQLLNDAGTAAMGALAMFC
jgi:light-harvesting complex 1 alpha chain